MKVKQPEKSEIEKALFEMASRETEVKTSGVEDAVKEHAYKIAFAKAILSAEGTEAVKKAQATISTEAQFLAHLKAKATYEFAKEKLRDVRQAISARQTIVSAEKESDKVHAQTM